MKYIIVSVVVFFLVGMQGIRDGYGESLRLNHIQVIGTHNSYHLRPPDEIMEAMMAASRRVEAWDYSHLPLDKQLDNGVRSFELDLHHFTEGFAVMHVPVVDEESSCPLFRDCLEVVRAWSHGHPGHFPISFLLEFKIDEAALGGKPLKKLDAAMLDSLEQEIVSVFPRDGILAPDDVRGNAQTLRDAVQEHGWPEVKETLGKVFFVLHNRTELRAAYTEGHPSLEGRLMFVNSSLDRTDCAFSVVDNPHHPGIPEMLGQGMMIRVRADSGLKQAKTKDLSKRDAAFASGAQIISTDYPPGQAHPDTGYEVIFPNNATLRCSPLVNHPDCRLLPPEW